MCNVRKQLGKVKHLRLQRCVKKSGLVCEMLTQLYKVKREDDTVSLKPHVSLTKHGVHYIGVGIKSNRCVT